MRRGHFIILVGGAVVLFLFLVFAELLSVGGGEEEASRPEGSGDVEVAVGVPDVEVVREETVRLPAVRGDIVDREGRVLATTEEAGRLRIDLELLLGYYRDELGKSVPENRLFVERSGEREMVVEDDVYAVVHALVVVPLREDGVILAARTEPIREHYRERRGEPLYLDVEETNGGDIDWEGWVTEMDGVSYEAYGKRVYPEGDVTGGVVGVLDIETGAGKRGAEKTFEAALRGREGKVVNEVTGSWIGMENK
ncbi:MAG: hypothetical protein AAF591_13945 [Verrucomicrobiota bacterium]